jgi:LAS superfamily LD-carboxypeptidase LdcB
MPTDLAKATNGRLWPNQLAPMHLPGANTSVLHPLAARAFGALFIAALAETGQTMTATSSADCYRSLDIQLWAWNDRMSSSYNPITCTTKTKAWNGKVYWLKRFKAECAQPGYSNHGWGLAVDVALWDATNRKTLPVDGNAWFWAWLLQNAASFGLSWETSETWHLRYTAGDNVPQRVLDIEKFLGAQK